MERVKELSNSLKSLIVKLWKDGESYRNMLSNLNIPFTTISLFIARFKRRNQVGNKKDEQGLQGRFILDYQKKIRPPD